jgi:type 1 fimbriae regulatory protein FimB/type 1 fimbriae regulatory protein FimE
MQTDLDSAMVESGNSPVNARFRESSSDHNLQPQRLLTSEATNSDTRFRESSSSPPRKVPNAARRSREYLTDSEVTRLMEAAEKIGRHGHRDACVLLLAYRHGLRVSELVALRWDQVDFDQGTIFIQRRKNGSPSTHPLRGAELRALRRLCREYPGQSYIFTGERLGPLTDSAVRKIVARAGEAAGLEFPVHPHMLRHATGYKLANDGQDTRAIQHYLGHKNITHTVRYTELSADRFKDFWQD